MSRRKTRGERVLELLALLLVVGGICLYAYAGFGMRTLETGQVERVGNEWLISHWTRYLRLSQVAIGLVVGGLVVGLASVLWFGRRVAIGSPQ